MLLELNNQELDHGFKQPLPRSPKGVNIKNKAQALKIFQKLPCIKTCMTKISFQQGESQTCPTQTEGIHKIEDDFEMHSAA